MRVLRGCLLIGLVWFQVAARGEDATYVYTVQISATVQSQPPQITLSWPLDDPWLADSYTIYRKSKTATSWGEPVAVVSGTTGSWTDSNVSDGSSYEYQIFAPHNLYTTNVAYGYIYAGIGAPLTETRGKLLLIVATNSTAGLDTELGRLQTDLTGDGWQVIRHDVPSNDTPADVRSLIIADYNADRANVNCVFLFGHVPILQSGELNYDGHLVRPMPADSYYADVDGDWSSLPDYLPSDVELMLGRVDLFNMLGNDAPGTWPNETELLRNYLNKDHAWRNKLFTVPRVALMGNLRGNEDGEASAASGYRNFPPLVGPGNLVEANVEYVAPASNRWCSMLASNSYLIAYGCGAGQPNACSGLGTSDGDFSDVRSQDIFAEDIKAPFVMLFGSWFGEWDYTDDLLRSVLCTPSMGLVACMAGRPHWYIHHLGLGETWGYSTRLSMNNDGTLYSNGTNILNRAIYVAMMGDPTLRLDPVGPPGNLSANADGSSVALSWSRSGDSVVGYYVYRGTSATGPFTRITPSLVAGTSFTDLSVPGGSYTYMVRAIKLQTTPSGTYYNPSQGIFAPVIVTSAAPPPITVSAIRVGSSIQVSWNTVAGVSYRVEAKTNLAQSGWSDISGTLTANSASLSWLDNAAAGNPQRFYRIMSP